MERIVTLDAAGRLVLPEDVRSRHHLENGSRMRIAEEADRIVLEPVESDSPLVEKDGLLLVDAPLQAASVDHRQLREERLARLAAPRR